MTPRRSGSSCPAGHLIPRPSHRRAALAGGPAGTARGAPVAERREHRRGREPGAAAAGLTPDVGTAAAAKAGAADAAGAGGGAGAGSGAAAASKDGTALDRFLLSLRA